jgi:hypothetical protein
MPSIEYGYVKTYYSTSCTCSESLCDDVARGWNDCLFGLLICSFGTSKLMP